MRYVYMALVVTLTAVVLLFKFQNLETVTVSFLTSSITLPASVLIIVVYVLGMFTGGFVSSLLRQWFAGARASRESQDAQG